MKLRKMIIVAVSILACLVQGCATDVANRYYLTERYSPREVSTVEVLHAPPTREYVVIADMQARQASVAYMQKQAAQLGADAVIVTLLGGYADRQQVWASEDTQATSYSRIAATAIKYK